MCEKTANVGLTLKFEQQSSETCKSVDYFNGIMAKFYDFFQKKLFCDITLVCNDEILKIQAHKTILCASSNYFLAMFGGSMQETIKKEVHLKSIDGPTLELVINYIYSSAIELTSSTVEKIVIAADLLELTSLKTLCCDFIAKQLDPSNCLGIALFADQYNFDELYNKSETFVCEHFDEICKDDEFFKLDIHQLCKFLSSSDICVDSEEDCFRILMSWVNHDRNKRSEFISKLLHHIRFPLLTPKYIATSIEPVCNNIESERMVCKAYKWHLLPEFRVSLYTDRQTQLRNFNGMLVALSGFENNGGNLTVGLHYPGSKTWIYKSEVPGLVFGRKGFGSTTFQGKLIIAGGYNVSTNEGTDQVDCLDMKTFKWSSFPPLNMKRRGFKMATLKGCIYAVGGINALGSYLNTMEKYDPMTNKWVYVTPIKSSSLRDSVKAVSVTLDKLCVSYFEGNVYHHDLYDADSDTWTYDWLVTNDGLIGTGTVSVFSNHFFIAVGYKTILRYNYVIKCKETIAIGSSYVAGSTDCKSFGDRMIAYGKNIFQEYNPFSDEWKRMPDFENTHENVVLVSYRP